MSHEKNWRTIQLPRDLVVDIESFLEADFARKSGFTSISQFVTDACRGSLKEYFQKMREESMKHMYKIDTDLVAWSIIHFDTDSGIPKPTSLASKEVKKLSSILTIILEKSFQQTNPHLFKLYSDFLMEQSKHGHGKYLIDLVKVVQFAIKEFVMENKVMPDFFPKITKEYIDQINIMSKTKLDPKTLWESIKVFGLMYS